MRQVRRHSREHTRHHRWRVINRWKFIYRNVFWFPQDLGPDWWDGEGRLARGKQCGCRMCRYGNAEQKFRRHRQAYYCRLENLEVAAY